LGAFCGIWCRNNQTAKTVWSNYNTTVWGAGTKWGVKGVCFDFRAVRGPLTRKAFSQHGCNVPEVYGDPALLLPFLYDPRPDIKPDPNIDMCIIPHMDDFSSEARFEWWGSMNGTQDISSRFLHIDHIIFESGPMNTERKVRLIDIRTPDASAFISALNTCNLVASASLHGIILAEAYGITWSWVQLNTKTEKPFKYHDFFLSIGISPEDIKPLLITASTTIDEIISHSLIPKNRGPSLYDPITLIDACPFCQEDVVTKLKEKISSMRETEREKTKQRMRLVNPETSRQIQVSHVTGMNRYPDEYLAAKIFF